MNNSESYCGTCSICLNSITPDQEAFLDRCFHQFCYKCIKEWTHTQRRHPPQRGPRFTCPLCKQAYYSIIFDCHESAFRRDQVDTPPRGPTYKPAAPSATFSQLTSAHRRRRSVYYSPPGGQGREEVAMATVAPRLAIREDLPRWVERELQALMWQDDVALVAQHVLGTLRSAVQPGSAAGWQPPPAREPGSLAHPAAVGGGRSRSRGASSGPAAAEAVQRTGGGVVLLKRKALALGSRNGGSQAGPGAGHATMEEVAAAVARAAAPYVFEHAERFGWELAFFVASGLGIAAHDRRLMDHQGQAVAAAAARAGGGASQSAGAHSGPGSAAGWAEGPAAAAQRSAASSDAQPSGSSNAGGASDEESLDNFGGAGALARSDDDEGYLGILMAQGRQRRRLTAPGGTEGPPENVQPVGAGADAESPGGAVGPPWDHADLAGPEIDGGVASRMPVLGAGTEREREAACMASGSEPWGGSEPAQEGAQCELRGTAELECYRNRALLALRQHRRNGSEGGCSK